MNLLIVTVVSLIALQLTFAADSKYDDHWEQYKVNHEKDYSSEEEEQSRREAFEGHLQDVMEHNAKHDAGLVSYVKSINHPHADKTIEELQQSVLGAVLPQNALLSRGTPVDFSRSLTSRASTVDYRGTRVTSVKNQGSCGSCWAFSAVGAMEGQLSTVGKSLMDLSQQQLVDCVYSNPKRDGCDGGWYTTAWDYVKSAGGIQLNSTYPYQAKQNPTCNFNKNAVVAKVSSSVSVTPAGDENAVANAVQQKGPLSVAIFVNNNLMNYKSGVYDDSTCTGDINHGVLLVGYGTDQGKDYWIVKNSWGPNWGEGGYIRMRRNSNNQCKIASYAAYPILTN